jgi:hypothetical protein
MNHLFRESTAAPEGSKEHEHEREQMRQHHGDNTANDSISITEVQLQVGKLVSLASVFGLGV